MTRSLSLAEFWCLVLLIDLNDGSWNDVHRDTGDAIDATLAVAAREVDEAWLSTWIRKRSPFEPGPR